MHKLFLVFFVLFIFQTTFSQTKKIIGFYEKNVEKQLNTEAAFDKSLSAENIGVIIHLPLLLFTSSYSSSVTGLSHTTFSSPL